MIKSSFGFAMPGFMPEHRLYANDLAGGGILDVGGYPVSMARLIAGAAAGKPFAGAGQGGGRRRISASPASTNGPRRCCTFPTASSPKSPAASRSNQDNVLRILGTKGRIEVKDFWFAGGHEGRHGRDRHHPARRHAKSSTVKEPR